MVKRPGRPAVALDSLGCKLNQAEIQQLARQLAAAGYRLVAPDDKADIYILNTCTVTHVADRKSRHMLRMARRRNPHVRLVAIGCYAGRAPGELAKIDGVDLIIDNARKSQVVQLLDGLVGRNHLAFSTSKNTYTDSRTRAFIKVQDGCRNFCAYCIVPLVRSREESVPVEQVLAQVAERASAGYREVVLTGTEIGAYNSGGVDLKGLLARILAETPVPRLRLSSLQPAQISPGLIGLWRNPRLCPHFHLSLQSGSDAVLRRMKRRYNTVDYRRLVSIIRDSVPDVAVTTDVIVGFPGETDNEFQETVGFCRQMRFARVHVFPYSSRPGTEAAGMPHPVPAAVKKERTRQMLAVAEESARQFCDEYLGKTLDVLWEQRSGGLWSGLTGNYIRVYARSDEDLTGRLSPVRLVKQYRDGVLGAPA